MTLTAVIWLKLGTVNLAKHLEISSNSYIQRSMLMVMLVPCCHTSLLHFIRVSPVWHVCSDQGQGLTSLLHSTLEPLARLHFHCVFHRYCCMRSLYTDGTGIYRTSQQITSTYATFALHLDRCRSFRIWRVTIKGWVPSTYFDVGTHIA